MSLEETTAGAGAAVAWPDIEWAGKRGPSALAELFRGMPEKDRKTLSPALKDASAALQGTVSWQARVRLARTLMLAGPALLGGPAGIAQWLAKRDFVFGAEGRDPLHKAVAEIIRDRNPAWLGNVAERLAQRMTVRTSGQNWFLVDCLARAAGGPPPGADSYMAGWLSFHGRNTKVPSLADSLRADSYTPVMVPRIFATDGVGEELEMWANTDVPERTWAVALRTLCDEGLVDRAHIVDRCLASMLRGAEPRHIRGFLALYEGLDVTDDEAALHAVTYLRLLADAPASVAVVAQVTLRRLDEADRLTAEQVEEATRAVLFRSEKKLLRPQFTWLGKAVKRHADHAGMLVAAAATAFAHPDSGIQDRTLAFIAKHLPKLAETEAEPVREELRSAVDMLTGTTRAGVLELLGESAEDAAPEGDAAPVHVPAELPPDIESLDELVSEVAAFIAARRRSSWTGARNAPSEDPWTIERIIAAMLREHARDRRELAAAMGPMADRVQEAGLLGWRDDQVDAAAGLGSAVVAAAGGPQVGRRWFEELFASPDGRNGRGSMSGHLAAPHRVLAGRLFETAERLRTPFPVPYLSRPADARGYVDAAEFVRGLEECAAAGRDPWPLDLEQALLRLPSTIDPEVVARVERLGTPAGKWAADVMAAGGMPAPEVAVVESVNRSRWQTQPIGYHLLPTVGDVPEPFADRVLARALCGMDQPVKRFQDLAWQGFPEASSWPLIVPGHRDVIAAHAALNIIHAVDNPRAGLDVLPVLAAADGQAGDGIAVAFAYGLAAREAVDRAHAVDGLIVLAGRGTDAWNPADLGRHLSELIRMDIIRTTRLAESLRQAVAGGASAAVWAVLAGMIPGLRGERPAGLGDLLAVAAECAARSGARQFLPGLEPYLGKGTSRIAVEARRLETILAG
ncbi:DUF6493 family protein [Uniformispora flossi]|uniref:DUF6493 family protein n=1 Tax=Uniformispora flossi TaxID=3390723 RepID=UPI003C30BE6F